MTWTHQNVRLNLRICVCIFLPTSSHGLWINVGSSGSPCFNATDFSESDNTSVCPLLGVTTFVHDFESQTLFAARQESLPAGCCMGLIELDDELNGWWL